MNKEQRKRLNNHIRKIDNGIFIYPSSKMELIALVDHIIEDDLAVDDYDVENEIDIFNKKSELMVLSILKKSAWTYKSRVKDNLSKRKFFRDMYSGSLAKWDEKEKISEKIINRLVENGSIEVDGNKLRIKSKQTKG